MKPLAGQIGSEVRRRPAEISDTKARSGGNSEAIG